MDKPFYNFKILEDALLYEFESISSEKRIKKSVRYAETSIPNLYNLSLVDVLENGTVSDVSVSNNHDMEYVLATVFQTCKVFLNAYPNCQVFFMGSTAARTRLYQIAINRELTKALEMFEIWGLTDEGLEPFRPNRTYQAFVLALK